MAFTYEGMKTKDKVIVFFLSVLLFAFFIAEMMAGSGRKTEITVENQKNILYDTSRITLPEAKEGSININTAEKSALMSLPTIGPSLAERIISYREENGPFPHPACIMEVSGIGEKTYEKIKDKIKVTE